MVQKSGLSLIEVLVALAIIGVVAALLLPAVQAAREASRRISCSNNLRQIGLGVANYESAFGVLPPGNIRGYGQHAFLLPFLGEGPLFDAIQWKRDAIMDETVTSAPSLAIYRCPSDPYSVPAAGKTTTTNYAANAGTGLVTGGYNGLFRPVPRRPTTGQGFVRLADVTDGLSNTACVSELLVGNGSSHRLRVNWRLAVEEERDEPAEFPAVMAECLGGNYALSASGQWQGEKWGRGRLWMMGDMGHTWYTHTFTPNRPSCRNGGHAVQTGIYFYCPILCNRF